MIKRLLGGVKRKFKGPAAEYMYRFLMRESQYGYGRKPFNHEELKLVTEALASQSLFGVDGKMVNAFEKEFGMIYGFPFAVASTSGTAAIHTALGALDLNPGDEVITAAITDMGTVIPILYQNAIPVFADIDDTYNMDPADVERKITNRTRSIIVVHLFGNPCNMDAFVAIAKKHNIPLLEDCSQTHLTAYKGKYVGTIGDIGCFSFQQSKHMTTGDGGMTITANKAYYDRMKLFVDKGFARKGWGTRAYAFHAPNYRMNELTAAVGRAQLRKVKSVVERRRQMGTRLTELLNDIPEFVTPKITDGAESSYWLYPLYLKTLNIEDFAKEMMRVGFWCAGGYTGKPIYLCSESLTAKKTYGTSQFPFNSSYASKQYEYKEGLCPKAEETLKHLVTMPWDESWSDDKVEKAAQAFKNTLQKFSPASIAVSAPKKVEALVVANAATPEKAVKKVRVGIIGCGQMGKWHHESLRQNPQVEFAAYVDTDIKRAKDLTNDAPANVYTDYKEMIKNEKLDGVSICTVPSTHREIVIDLLNAGINVLCEKPLAMSASQAEEMLTVANKNNLLLLTAFKFRYFDEVRAAKEILDKKLLGKILNFRLMFGGYADMTGTWFANKAVSGGGVIIDNGPHALDLVRHLLGEVEDVRAFTTNPQGLSVEDTAHITCKLKDGGSGSVDLSWTIPLSSKTYLEIYGEEGTMLLDFDGMSYKFKTWDEWKRIANTTGMKDAFTRQLNHFVEAIISKKPTVTINEDGVKNQQLIEKAYASLK